MDQEHPLKPILLKLDRADEHIHTLSCEFQAFTKENRLRLGSKVDFKTGWHTFFVEGGQRLPPRRLSILAGESLYQARSALEHLVWALVKTNHKKPGRHNTFPVMRQPIGTKGLTDQEAFIAKTKLDELRGVPMAAITLIERLQPYNTGNSPDYWLTLLNDMARDDRHRLPHPHFVGGKPEGVEPLFIPHKGATITAFKTLLRENRSIVVGQTKVARVKIHPLSHQPKVHVNGVLPTVIAFGDRRAMLQLGAVYELNTMTRVAVHAFQKFF